MWGSDIVKHAAGIFMKNVVSTLAFPDPHPRSHGTGLAQATELLALSKAFLPFTLTMTL